MVYAVAEPYAFQIFRHRLEIPAAAVAFPIGIDSLEHLAYAQVVSSVLVEDDVPTLQSRLLQIIHQLLLFQCQLVEAGHLIAHHLDVGEFLVDVIECFRITSGGNGQCSCNHHLY